MQRRNAGPPDIPWQLVPPSGKVVTLVVPIAGEYVRVRYFAGHYASLTRVGFGEMLMLQIAFFRNHVFKGGDASTYFRYRTDSGIRYRVTALFTRSTVEITDLESAVPAMTE